MPSFVKSLISSTMETSNHIQGMRENLQKMQDIEQQRQNEEDDRQRNLAMTSYKAYSDVLSDPERYKNLSDDEIAKHSGGMLAAATTLKKLGVDLPDSVDDPMPAYVAKLVFKLQTDPAMQKLPPLHRLHMLRGQSGKYYEQARAILLNTAALRTPQESRITNQQEIDSKQKSNNDIAVQRISTGNGPTNPQGSESQFQAVPKPVMSEYIPSLEEQESEQLFGQFYRPESEYATENYKYHSSLSSDSQHTLAINGISPNDPDYWEKKTQFEQANPSVTLTNAADAKQQLEYQKVVGKDLESFKSQAFQDLFVSNPSLQMQWMETHNAHRALAGMEPVNYDEFTGLVLGETAQLKNKGQVAKTKKTEAEIKKLDNDIRYRWAQLTETQRSNRVKEANGDAKLALATFSANTARMKIKNDINSASPKGVLTSNVYENFHSKYTGWTLVADEKDKDGNLVKDNSSVRSAGSAGLMELDERYYVKPAGVNEIASILRKKRPLYGKDPKVTGTSAVAFVSGALDRLGVPEKTKNSLVIKYMNAYFWEKK